MHKVHSTQPKELSIEIENERNTQMKGDKRLIKGIRPSMNHRKAFRWSLQQFLKKNFTTMLYFHTLGLKADLPADENPDRRRQTLDFQLNNEYTNTLAVENF